MSTALFSTRHELGPLADEMFYQRWSPRSMVKTNISSDDLLKMIDAARWSPSCFNDQPWHFIFSTDDTFDQFLGLLLEGNQIWCKNASRIGFMLARKNFQHDGSPNRFSQFDAGAAWMSFVYQAYAMGYVMHGLGGIHKERVFDELHVDKNDFEVMCGLVIGKRDDVKKLPKEFQEREKPNTRKPLHEMYHLNSMKNDQKIKT
ncbi:MAG: nitroreductase family protein [Bdellovibrionales bacterium]|nr:nitroreductase family protein [Bdellovibrionales bacterium]